MSNAITADTVIAKYIADRDRIAELNKQIDAIKVLQGKREEWLASRMDTDHAKGLSTTVGSCNFYTLASVAVADGGAFKEWVHAAWDDRKHFLNNAASKDAVSTFVADGNPPPPGVNYTTIRKVKVVRPK